jgi:AcrR family transcriptional regulator
MNETTTVLESPPAQRTNGDRASRWPVPGGWDGAPRPQRPWPRDGSWRRLWQHQVIAAKSLKDEHAEATRAALVSSARELFARHGYSAVSVVQIVEGARVTRGALYHHFPDKRELFAAVCEQIQGEVSDRVNDAMDKERDDSWQALVTVLEVFLDASLEPDVQQVLEVDAPAVLGTERLHALDAQHGFGLLVRGLTQAVEAGVIERQPVEPLAHLLLGALMEASTVIARSEEPEQARARLFVGLQQMASGFRTNSDSAA